MYIRFAQNPYSAQKNGARYAPETSSAWDQTGLHIRCFRAEIRSLCMIYRQYHEMAEMTCMALWVDFCQLWVFLTLKGVILEYLVLGWSEKNGTGDFMVPVMGCLQELGSTDIGCLAVSSIKLCRTVPEKIHGMAGFGGVVKALMSADCSKSGSLSLSLSLFSVIKGGNGVLGMLCVFLKSEPLGGDSFGPAISLMRLIHSQVAVLVVEISLKCSLSHNGYGILLHLIQNHPTGILGECVAHFSSACLWIVFLKKIYLHQK